MEPGYFRIIYLLEMIVLCVLILYAWSNHHVNRKIKHSFVAMCVSLIIWSFCVFMITISDSKSSIWFWHEAKYLGILPLPSVFLIFALRYARKEHFINRALKSVLVIIPALFFITILVDPLFHFFRVSHEIVQTPDFVSIQTVNGLGFWLNTAYTYFILFIVVVLLIMRFRELPKGYKGQPLLIITAMTIQAAVNASFVFNLFGNISDPSALTFCLTALMTFWGIFYFPASDIIPIARSLVVEDMNALLFVKDYNGYLVDSNKLAREAIKRIGYSMNSVKFDDVLAKFIKARSVTTSYSNGRKIFRVPKNDHINYFTFEETDILKNKRKYGSIVMIHNVTKEQNYIQTLEKMAQRDALTGLYHRTYFETIISDYPKEKKVPITFFYGGINSFKIVNESFGSEVGDKILVEVAKKLELIALSDMTIARTGGDEFCLLVANMKADEADQFCQKIENEIHEVSVENVNITISFGHATISDSSVSMQLAFSEAMKKMYRKKLNDLQSSRSSLINSLKIALEQSDLETKAHADRTEELAILLGKKIGLNDSQLNDLSMLSSLHDLGKIAIPDAILLKPSKLTDEEFEVIKTHPQKGYVIALASPELVHIADGILHHHERWDGRGYPDGLKGEEISVEARIICLVDAFDVMTNERPYKKAMTHDEAIAELVRCRGTQFDPTLVDYLIETLNQET